MQIFIFENKETEYKQNASKTVLLPLALENHWGTVSYSNTGKPLIEHGYISVTHTKNILLVAYESFPIGIDCEFPRPISKHLIDRLQLNPDQPLKAWCQLEAWIKLDDKPSHLTEKIPTDICFTSIDLKNTSICVCASYQAIETIEIIKKD